MRNILFWGTTLLVLVVLNFLIYQKEKTLTNGQTMLLRLAPVDPRSLIQGDYMILRYEMAQKINNKKLSANNGFIVVSLDEKKVAKFIRLHKDEALQPNEHLLSYKNRGGIKLGAESFFFQEGDAKIYGQAKYGELKVDKSGKSVLVGLRDVKFIPLGK
ncbi:MAG: hypothetical protein COA79_17280 [Planctomycetota bacterium]|nr:MAG: hypothetical protein COA79_17280 [Planctomycetota bacterium]